MSYILPIKTEFNIKAKEYKPSKKIQYKFLDDLLKEKIYFDKLENDFIKNNGFLFDL